MTSVSLRLYYQTEEELLKKLTLIENKSELNYLNVFQCKILELSLPLNHFSNLLTLEFRKCFIRYLPDDIFSNLLQLDKINLEMNQISVIPDNLFEKNTKLTAIILKYNLLQDFNTKLFLPLKDLSYLDLRYNEITEVPSYCLNCPNLTILRLSNNRITLISCTALYGIRNLRYLELHNNQIWKLKSDFLAKSIELRYLSLNNNNLKELPPFLFLPVRKLEILLLSNIKLMELTRHVLYNNSNLTSLDLSNNEISSIRKDLFNNVPLLKYLCISVRLHFEFQSIANLKYLGYFELVFTGPPIAALSSDLAHVFRNKKQLETMRLFFYNFDNSRNTEFYLLPDLKILQIECFSPDAKNGDINLERQFNQVPQLETLILKKLNYFTVVKTDDTFEFNLVHLKHLDLTGVKNTTITDTFYFFISLQYLNLSYSEISVISDNAFISLSNLKLLDLHCSKLKQITAKIFEFNYELQVINLAHNCLETIEDYSFKNLKKLKELHLKDNPLQNLNNDKPFYDPESRATKWYKNQFCPCKKRYKKFMDHKMYQDDFWIRDGQIINPEKLYFDDKIQADRVIDCNGCFIVPGFIDLQINGGFGIDFSHNQMDVGLGVNIVAKGILQYGVTSFCPTLVTSSKESYKKTLPYIRKRNGSKELGATVLGCHLEGPFISIEKRGAHCELLVRPSFPDGFASLVDMYGDLSNVEIVTIAPEIPNAIEVIRKLKAIGVTVSLGHSMADLSQGEAAISAGANFITHLFNAMLPFHHRDPGLVGLLASTKVPKNAINYGIIADGVHTHPAALRIAHLTNPGGLVLVTDAISAMGYDDGIHQIGTKKIEIRHKKAYIENTDTLCGSIATMIDCVKMFKTATECPLEVAIEAATLHPARILGIENRKGTLKFEADADFLILSPHLTVMSTWINGECVYSHKSDVSVFI